MAPVLRRCSAAALAVALLLPASSAADLSAGPAPAGKRGFRIAFDVGYQGNEPRVVNRFKFKNVVVTCEVGPPPNPFTTDSKPPHFGPMSVNEHGRFSRVFSNNGQSFNGNVVIRGHFRTKRSVKGTLKITGDYPNAGYEGCASGRVKWAAKVGPNA